MPASGGTCLWILHLTAASCMLDPACTKRRQTSCERTTRDRRLSARKRRVTSGPKATPMPRLLGARPCAGCGSDHKHSHIRPSSGGSLACAPTPSHVCGGVQAWTEVQLLLWATCGRAGFKAHEGQHHSTKLDRHLCRLQGC